MTTKIIVGLFAFIIAMSIYNSQQRENSKSERPAPAQQIEFKGLHLGMSRAEVQKKAGPLPLKDFTIAGVGSKYSTIELRFHEDKLDSLAFLFHANRFDDVLEAVRAKYPALECKNTTVTNAIGGSFTQTDCTLKDMLGTLTLTRFVSDIRTSVLSLTSDRAIKEYIDEERKRKKDI